MLFKDDPKTNHAVFFSMDMVWSNMPNMHHKVPPSRFPSFYDFWLVNVAATHAFALQRGYHRTCQNEYCKSEYPTEMIGAHLSCNNKDIDLTVVAPICRECNHPTNGGLIKLPQDMPVIKYWGEAEL